jgi:hypothetical protein
MDQAQRKQQEIASGEDVQEATGSVNEHMNLTLVYAFPNNLIRPLQGNN